MMNVKIDPKNIRKEIFKVAYTTDGAHLGGCFSCVEILYALYFKDILKIDTNNLDGPNRDRFILSKGHAGLALYVVLYMRGIITKQQLYSYGKIGGNLGAHPKINDIPGIEATTGSLGHGLAYSAGLALAGQIQNKDYHVYCLVGDGECQEGSIWETALFAPQNQLSNLTVIIDSNKMQAMDYLSNIIDMEPLADKWKSFGWDVHSIDGHDIEALTQALSIRNPEKPVAIIANTIKAKGVSFMIGQPLWHFRMPNDDELKVLCSELEIDEKELRSLCENHI